MDQTEHTAWSVVAGIVASLLLAGCTTAMGSDRFESYDSGGSQIISRYTTATQLAKETAHIRDFIWTHWQAHRLGHMVVTWITTEGEPNTFSFLIEPDKLGKWCVTVQVEVLQLQGGYLALAE